MRIPASLLLLMLISFTTAYSQSAVVDALTRAKKVSLLQPTRAETRNLFWDFDSSLSDEPGQSDTFEKDGVSVEIYYSSGGCTEEEEIWDVAEGSAIKIEITVDEPQMVKQSGVSLSGLKKERSYYNRPTSYIYYRSDKTLAVDVDDNRVQKITLQPVKDLNSKRCNNERAEEFSSDKWFTLTKLKDRPYGCTWKNMPANVEGVTLSNEQIAYIRFDKNLRVSVMATDPENDVLTYSYTVDVGKIIGTGSNVIWNLEGVPAGTYNITVGVDDGAGIVGKTVTKTVVIK